MAPSRTKSTSTPQLLRFLNVALLAASTFALLGANCAIQKPYRGRQRTKPTNLRDHVTFTYVNRVFCEREFRHAYRMSRCSFNCLLFLVLPDLKRDKEMGRRAGRPAISPDVRLGIFLRVMAGASVYDCMMAYAVGCSTVYEVFKSTKDAIDRALYLPGLPDSYYGLKNMADDFQTSRSPCNPLPGCVGALDGISVRIKKPSYSEHPSTFYCRKDYYALPVQALVDSNYCFLCFSAKCRGSTHDSLAHAVSALGRYLSRGHLADEFWIAGDEAYVCSQFLISPVPASQAGDYEDAFNFYHSSLRMHVEQAFRMLVNKWPLLLSMRFSVNESAQVIGIALKLHNFCIDQGERMTIPSGRSAQERVILEQSQDWYEEGKHYNFEQVGRQDGGRSSQKRDMLIDIIKLGGYSRPPVVPLRLPAVFRTGSSD